MLNEPYDVRKAEPSFQLQNVASQVLDQTAVKSRLINAPRQTCTVPQHQVCLPVRARRPLVHESRAFENHSWHRGNCDLNVEHQSGVAAFLLACFSLRNTFYVNAVQGPFVDSRSRYMIVIGAEFVSVH